LVDIVPPSDPTAVADFDAWRAHVFGTRKGCGDRTGAEADYSKLNCNATACWFFANTISFGGGNSASGNWYLMPSNGGVAYSSYKQRPTTLPWSREASALERQAYESPAACPVTCPPAPPTQYYDNPCAGGGAPGWCFPGWDPPFGFESPLVFNLSGGTDIGWLGRPVSFNLDGKGSRPLDWVLPQHPFLAVDLNGNGSVDDGTELFGTATVVASTGTTAPDGFAALAQYDDNGDKKIDAGDAVYKRLLLWFDKNSNGVSDAGELSLLMFSGVDSIDLNAKPQSQDQQRPAPSGAFITRTSTFGEEVCSGAFPMLIADAWFPTAK
jgi:hypothetical protein